VYKSLAKVLAFRLRKVISKVVGPYQHAFIAGREILDATLIANELDIENTYDHVSWGSLITILKRMDFLRKWRQWVYFCTSTFHFSVLLNGEATGSSLARED